MKAGIVLVLLLAAALAWAHEPYPDQRLTPGDVLTTDARVICAPGYIGKTRNVPPALKREIYRRYEVKYPQPAGKYEVDHMIPLGIGGSNDLKNLGLQPASPRPGFHEKDRVETYLHEQICHGRLTPQQAQQDIFKWEEIYQLLQKGKGGTR